MQECGFQRLQKRQKSAKKKPKIEDVRSNSICNDEEVKKTVVEEVITFE